MRKSSVVLFVFLFNCASAFAAQWMPYTDGRVGGCFLDNGHMFGCTPQPPSQQSPPQQSPQHTNKKLRQQQQANQQLQEQLQAVQQQEQQNVQAAYESGQRAQYEAQQRAAYENQQRATEAAEQLAHEAWLETPDGIAWQKQRAQAAAQERQRVIDIQTKLRASGDLSECMKSGGVPTCTNAGCTCN